MRAVDKNRCQVGRNSSCIIDYSGFTLVELIVALTVLSLVTLIISSGFRLGLNAWHKGESEINATERLRVLSGPLFQQLKSAYAYKAAVKDEDEQMVLFKGEEDSLLFVTTNASAAEGGFKWVRYSFKEGTLFYKEGQLPDKEFEEKITGKEEVADTDVGEVIFSYYSFEDKEWKDKWEYGKEMPSAVKVKISYYQPFFISIPMGQTDKEVWNKDAS